MEDQFKIVFSKKLTVTDIKKSLAVPTRSLPLFPLFNEGHKVTFPVLFGTSRWTIDCTIRKMGYYKKPVLSGKPWLRFATANKLQVGDRFTLYKVQDQGGSSYYRVKVGEEIHFFGIPDWGANAMGHQGLLQQPTTPYGAELALTLAPPNLRFFFPVVDTPRHSSNTREAVHSQGQGSVASQTALYFSKHDTIKLGTIHVPSPLIIGNEGQLVNNPAFLVHKKQDKFLASWLLFTVTDDILVHLTIAKTIGSLVTEKEQVSIILAGLSIEYESIRVIASATLMSLDLLTEMLLDCEARQMGLLTEVPLQANLVSHQKHVTVDSSKHTATAILRSLSKDTEFYV
ncbi:hypothetical protein Goshw_025044 [Gossypium schwendimanii]|uniref:TF-B3 domain-containing protein n=1 Tax=Gossypium schwendimanii TaxID=34291 RepID=A0A7J9L5G0_GOSSC|nr:hypothetical protein [Gossypium schwendimanii]